MTYSITDLQVIEVKNERLMTTSKLAEIYETDERRIAENFKRNQDRYIEGKHYICLKGDDLRAFKGEYANCGFAKNLNVLYLWTEYGCLLHAKSLNTEKAWEMYEKLLEVYFRAKKADEEYRSLSLTTQSIINLELANKKLRKDLDEMAQRFTELERAVKPKAKLEAAAKKSGITGKPWSEREKDFLRDAFQMGLSDLEIAAKLDRTEWAISNKRRKMDMYHANGSKHWTKAEVKKLKRLHGMGLTAREIGQIVGKTTSAVNAKVCKLRKDGKL